MEQYLALLQVVRPLIPLYGPVIRETANEVGKELKPLLDDAGEYLRKQSVEAVLKNFDDFQMAGFTREEAFELTKLFTPTLQKTLQEVGAVKKSK